MTSKPMIRRVQSALEATYRAWEFNTLFAQSSPSHEAEEAARWWETCYQVMRALNRMQIEGRTDNEIDFAWTALRTEVKLTMSLPQYGMFVRAIYPAPRTDALTKCWYSDIENKQRIRTAQAKLDLVARQKLGADHTRIAIRRA